MSVCDTVTCRFVDISHVQVHERVSAEFSITLYLVNLLLIVPTEVHGAKFIIRLIVEMKTFLSELSEDNSFFDSIIGKIESIVHFLSKLVYVLLRFFVTS